MNSFLFAVVLLFQPFVALAKEDEAESALTALCEEVSDPFDRLMFMHQSHDVVFRQTMGNGSLRMVGPRLNFSHEMGEDLSENWRSEYHLNHLVATDLIGLLVQRLPRVYLIQSQEVLQKASDQKALEELVRASGLMSLPSAGGSTRQRSSGGFSIQKTKSIDNLAGNTPSRALDAFEAFALTKIQKGSNLIKMENGHQIRAVGAIRAAQTCLRCHDGNVGELLGAFTYFIAKTPAESHSEDYRKMRRDLAVLGTPGLTPFLQPLGIPNGYFVDAHAWIARQGFVTTEMVESLKMKSVEDTHWMLGELPIHQGPGVKPILLR